MRVAVDATPLLGPRTGVGRYVAALVAALAALPDPPDISLTAFSWRGHRPPVTGAAWRRTRAPARLLQAVWRRADVPPVEWLAGRAEVFHATNFVLPPLRGAAGVVTVHDMSYLRFPHTVTTASLRYRELVPRGLRRAGAVVVPSHAVRGEVCEAYGLAPERVLVTPLGVDAAWRSVALPTTEQRTRWGLPDRYLLFVGTAEPRKNLPTLLAAYAVLRGRRADAPPLALVGPAGWGPALDAAALPRDAVRVLGWRDDDELRPLVAGATAVVLPSLYEGFGLPVLEAMACGTQVVASDVPAVTEVLGGLGRVTPTGDAEALADALAAAVDDPGNEADRRARIRRSEEYTWTRTATETMRAYRLALSAPA